LTTEKNDITAEMLRAQEAALHDLGNALREVAPSVDVCDAVMKRVRRLEAENDFLAQALLEVGSDLRISAPTLDIAGDVMVSIAEQQLAASTAKLEEELVETGEEIRALAPRVDVVEEVMDEVASGRLDNVTSFAAARRAKVVRRNASPFSWRFVAATAACVLAVLGFVVMQMAQPPALRGRDIAQRVQTVSSEQKPQQSMRYQEGEPLGFKPASSDQRISILSSTQRPAAAAPVKEGDAQKKDVQLAVNVEDVIAAKREALADNLDALAQLARWGALDPDEVRRLLAEGVISLKELAGISRFLPEEEARALLKDAVTKEPNDPLLRYALAKNLMNDPEQYDEALRQLSLFHDLTPDNSLSYYMDAQIRLSQGDYAGALQAIEYASAFQSGSAYALENAQFHSAALQAAGFPADVAQMLAAFNAGTDEYGFITQLGSNLLGYGAYYESIGDYDTALAIYKGVNQLGLQINQGADFSNEMLAGLDTQQGAIEAMDALADMMDIPGGAYTVEIAYTVLMQGMDFFLEYTDVFENMIGNAEAANMLQIIQRIMQVGDLQYSSKP